ncbi:MAG TPA: hypothetical protein DCZ94_01285 [Lentisphaeria bacterium]|nr:MAG: hypothetical protein A2X48_11495 [Lentisphaerae bacterium GWF2_49_21]HBC85564.1 hypothetical protein [Lentisphaeria bacterium]
MWNRRPSTGSGQGSPVIRGIYRLEGDKLVICTAAAGDEKPTEFKTSADTGTVLTELKRKIEGTQPKDK